MAQYSKKLNSKIIILGILALGILAIFVYSRSENKTKDFHLEYTGGISKVIVGHPKERLEKYPLVIYHHGGGNRNISLFELRELSDIFAEEGFIFWAPERNIDPTKKSIENIQESKIISEEILKAAFGNEEIDKDNINIVGFDLGALITLETVASQKINSISLIGLGAPYYNTYLYDYYWEFVDDNDLSYIQPNVLIMVSEEDAKVDIELAEVIRQKLIASDKEVKVVTYPAGGNETLRGVNKYVHSLISYLSGEEITTSKKININPEIKERLKKLWRTGYW